MPFDAYFLSAVVAELSPVLIGARVDKIQQPSRDTVLLTFRGREKLLLSANVNRPRLHLTQAAFDNPAQPPMFCMLLRKHLSGGRLAAIVQPPAERAVELLVDAGERIARFREHGDAVFHFGEHGEDMLHDREIRGELTLIDAADAADEPLAANELLDRDDPAGAVREHGARRHRKIDERSVVLQHEIRRLQSLAVDLFHVAADGHQHEKRADPFNRKQIGFRKLRFALGIKAFGSGSHTIHLIS